MRISSDFKYSTRRLCILLVGLVCIGLLIGNVSAIPGPAPNVSVGIFHASSEVQSGNNSTTMLPPVKAQSLSVSEQAVKTKSISGTMAALAVKDIPENNIAWQKCFGGTREDAAASIARTTDGGFIFCGYSNSTDGNVTGNHGNYDYWVVKFNETGAIEWQKNLGGSAIDIGMTVNQTTDNGFLITGYSYSTDGNVTGNHGADDVWALKLSQNGTTEWSTSLGGSQHDWAYSGVQTTDGGYFIGGGAGSNDGNVSGNHGDYDLWVQKLNADGTLVWQKCLGGSGEDRATAVVTAPEGGYLAAGMSESTDGDVTGNHGDYDAWIVGLNTTGGLEWQTCLGGSGDDSANSIISTRDGGYLIGGYTNSTDGNVSGNHGFYDAWIAKLDAKGNMTWQKCLGGTGDDGAESVVQDFDGGYLIAGYTNSNDGDVSGNHGEYDAWIVKLDAQGDLIWQKCLGGTGDDDAWSLVHTNSERYMVAGYTNSNDGDVSGNHGTYDAWILDLTSSDSEKPTPTVDMETLLSQPGPNGGTSMLGSVDNWSLNAVSPENNATENEGSDSLKVSFTADETKGTAPLTVRFTSACQGNPTSYYWNFGDGTTSGKKDPAHTYTVPGTYSVTLKIMNATSGALGVLPGSITVADGRIFAKKYQAPGTV